MALDTNRRPHLSLGEPITISMRPEFKCPECGELLWVRCHSKTNWQKWLFTYDGRRHYKRRCNLTPTPSQCPGKAETAHA